MLEDQGAVLVAAIENYRTAHGAYPADAEAAALVLPDTPYGPWKYMLLPDGSFEISVGDYGRDGFALWWEPRKNDWYLDE